MKLTMKEFREMVGFYGSQPSIETPYKLVVKGLCDHYLSKNNEIIAKVNGLLGASKLEDIVELEYIK